jgi:hypothetical protein
MALSLREKSMPGDDKLLSHENEKLELDPRARFWGSSLTGLSESILAFPLDKYKNNRMANPVKASSQQAKILQALGIPKELGTFKSIALSYRGFVLYGGHKIINRGLKIGAQEPLMQKIIDAPLYEQGVTRRLGKEKSKIVAATGSGVFVGFLEVLANPVDKAKFISQSYNKSSLDAVKIVISEGLTKSYAGWKETAVRNGVGAGFLFLGKFWAYNCMGVTNHNNPTFLQSFSSSMIGAGLSISCSHLPDLAKTRAQNDDKTIGMIKRLKTIAQQEGPLALTEGYLAKLGSSGLKLTFVLTCGDMLMRRLNTYYKEEGMIAGSNYNPRFYAAPSNQSKPAKVDKEEALQAVRPGI